MLNDSDLLFGGYPVDQEPVKLRAKARAEHLHSTTSRLLQLISAVCHNQNRRRT